MSSTSSDQPTLQHLWNNFGKLESNQNAVCCDKTENIHYCDYYRSLACVEIIKNTSYELQVL